MHFLEHFAEAQLKGLVFAALVEFAEKMAACA